jgi:hypothetical protein
MMIRHFKIALSSMIENTAFMGDLVLYLPDATKVFLKYLSTVCLFEPCNKENAALGKLQCSFNQTILVLFIYLMLDI